MEGSEDGDRDRKKGEVWEGGEFACICIAYGRICRYADAGSALKVKWYMYISRWCVYVHSGFEN